MGVVSGLLILVGSVFSLLAGIGVLRFRDTYSRMHSAAKASTLGILLVIAGAAVELRTTTAYVMLGLVVLLQLLTTPVGTHMLGSGLHRHVGAVSEQDELAADEADASLGPVHGSDLG